MNIRQKYAIPKHVDRHRSYEMQEETAYGEYAQIDFGERRMKDTYGKNMKVYFFAMVMCRQKYIYFSQSPFNTSKTIYAHELAFHFFAASPARSYTTWTNTLHEKTSVIITTNKSPTEWAKDMNDEVLTTALLDRLLYHCEVIKLDGNCYRMANRKTIFEKKKEVLSNKTLLIYQKIQVIHLLYEKMMHLNLHVTEMHKKATRWPIFDDEKGYLPFFVLLSCGAGVSSFSTAS